MPKPIAFIPGLFGSKLSLQGEPIWDGRQTIIETLRAPRRLLDDGVRADAVFDTVEFSSLRFGPLRVALEILRPPAPVYEPILEFLRERSDYVLHPFSYNWVKSVDENGDRLWEWLRDTPHEGAWTIVAHSMGGLVLSSCLARHRDEGFKIEKMVVCGSPFLGSARSLGAMLGLDDELRRFLSPLWQHVRSLDERSRLALREVFLQMPSLHDLLPWVPERPVYDTNGRAWTIEDLPELLDSVDSTLWKETRALGSFKVSRARGYMRTTGGPAEGADRILSAFSSSHETPSAILLDPAGPSRYADFVRGDGVVTTASAIHSFETTETIPLAGSHAFLVTSDDFLLWLGAFLASP